MTRLEKKLGDLQRAYEQDMAFFEHRLKDERFRGANLTGDRGNVFDRIRTIESDKRSRTERYRREIRNCSRNNRR